MIDYQAILNWQFEEIRHEFTRRETMLYAVGIGMGTAPTDPGQLRFVYEKNLLAVPSMASILCYPNSWLKDPRTGVDHRRVMNGGTQVVLHQPLPVEGIFRSRPRVLDVVDKGKGNGAVVRLERQVYDERTEALVCTVTTTSFCRGHGGFGGPTQGATVGHASAVPDTQPDLVVQFCTPRNLALLYRLSGDSNPLHADPEVARAAGFDEPILHGLCTFGIATHAVLAACCEYDPSRITALHARYTSFVVPGDTLETQIWRLGATVRFRCVVPVRNNAVVLDFGQASLCA